MIDLALPEPSLWPAEPLGDLCDIVIGRTPSRSRPEYWGGELPWLSIADMNQGRHIRVTKERITRLGATESRSRLIPAGTVLLSFKLSIGKIAVSQIDTFTNEAIAALPVLNPKKLSKDYLFWALQSIRLDEEVDEAAKGKTLNSGKLQRLRIPLPPLDEQRRIAAVLDKADTLRRQRQESLHLTDQLIQSVFIDMFVENPEKANWAPRTVESLAAPGQGSIRTGPFGSQLLHSEFVDEGIAVLGIDNAVRNRFEWGQLRFITREKDQSLQRYRVFPGDIIITIMGTCGRCAIVPEDIPEAINTKHLCCISLNRRVCLPEFLHACFLHHPEILWQLGVRTKGAVMPGLNMGIIKALSVRVPPIKLQEAFREAVARTATLAQSAEVSDGELDRLFASIQQRAFRGELDLSRVSLSTVPAPEPGTGAQAKPQRKAPHRQEPSFPVPEAIEKALVDLDRRVKKGDVIAWSADFFTYRILGIQPPPFSFGDLLRTAEAIFEEPPPYEEIKRIILELLEVDRGGAKLVQEFDNGRKEIVLRQS